VGELPFGKTKKWATSGVGAALFGDWTVSGIWAMRTGRPFTVNQSNNNVGQNMTGLPDQVGEVTYPETVERWFDPSAFRPVASGTFGNEERNGLRGPDWKSFDLSLQRRINFGARLGAILRWDIFNLFNRTNLGLPNRNLADTATVGSITSLSGDPRIMQLSIRLVF
jgi:hypothetical protein